MSKSNRTKARQASRKLRIENSAKGLTSQAGLIPVVKFLDQLNLRGLIADNLTVKRGDNAVYDFVDILFLSIVGIVGGSKSLLGIVYIWSDSVLRKVGGWLRIPDDSTFGRIFKSLNESHIAELETLNHRLRSRVWKKCFDNGVLSNSLRRVMWIDVDSTVKTSYGRQEGVKKGYNPHKRGALSYHPLLAFCVETKEILQGWLRSGNAYTSNGIIEFMKQLLAHIPKKVRIVFRGDSGFFAGDLLTYLEDKGHGYLVKVKMKGLLGLLEQQKWTPIIKQPGWEQAEFSYSCGEWKRDRRFVAVRLRSEEKVLPQRKLFEYKCYDYFSYVTSEDLTPWQTHKKYGKRATCETWIDEAKNQMGLAHIKTDKFVANAALFQCAILAYNTVRWMAICSGDKVLRRWEMQTVRTFLVRVAGKLLGGSRQLKLKTPKSHLHQTQWEAWVAVGLA